MYADCRTQFLESLGLQVLRFNNLEILNNITGVVEKIWNVVQWKIPPNPPFAKGESDQPLKSSATFEKKQKVLFHRNRK